MTHASCPDCRLRFSAGAAAYLVVCSNCGGPVHITNSPAEVFGYRLEHPSVAASSLGEAVAVAMPLPVNAEGDR
jgi:hypothetical protein